MSYAVAAYAITVAGFVAYGLGLARARRRLVRELAGAPAEITVDSRATRAV